MRFLITGGSGFIGSNLVHHLLHTRAGAAAPCCPDSPSVPSVSQPDLQVLNFDSLTYAGSLTNLRGVDSNPGYGFVRGDITDASQVDAVFRSFEPQAVLHLAAESHVDRSIEAGEVFARTNAVGTQVLLDAARRHDVEAFVHVSTDEVYGSIAEGSFTEGSPLKPSSPYSASKAASDLLALAHHHTYGLPVCVTRCTNNYGPRQHVEKLVPKAITLALAGRPVPVYGTGRQVRDWLYVKDHCEAIAHVADLCRWGSIFNISGQNERTNLEVVRDILVACDRPPTLIQHVQDRPGHDFRYSLDDSLLRGLGWRPRIAWRDGLRYCLSSRPPAGSTQ